MPTISDDTARFRRTTPTPVVQPKLSASTKALPVPPVDPGHNRSTNRHGFRVALATGTTIAVMLGTQALAIFGRTADANPVIIGTRSDSSDGSAVTTMADASTDVPTDQPSSTAIATNTPVPSLTSTATYTSIRPSSTPAPTNTAHPTTGRYVVVSNDTLGSIAAKYHTTISTLLILNKATLPDANRLQVGQVLLVPGPLSTDPLTPTPTATITLTPSSTPTASSTPVATSTATPRPTATIRPYVAPTAQPAPVSRSSRR